LDRGLELLVAIWIEGIQREEVDLGGVDITVTREEMIGTDDIVRDREKGMIGDEKGRTAGA
jgi:hypothetical protein